MGGGRKVRLLGVRERIETDLAVGPVEEWGVGVSVIDTRLPVSYDDEDEESDYRRDEPEFVGYPSGAIARQRELPAKHRLEDVGRYADRGADRYSHQPQGARVRGYSVAYYYSQHALDAVDDGRPPVSDFAMDSATHQLVVVGTYPVVASYNGRHRHVRD